MPFRTTMDMPPKPATRCTSKRIPRVSGCTIKSLPAIPRMRSGKSTMKNPMSSWINVTMNTQ